MHLLKHAEIMLDDAMYTPRWKELVAGSVPNYEERHAAATNLYQEDYLGVQGDESSADAYYRLGVYLRDVDRYPEAIDAYQKALEMDPRRDNAYFNIGACYEYQHLYPEAIENYTAELTVDPIDEDVPYRVGRVLVKMNRYDEALEWLDHELIEEDSSLVHYYRARAHEELGNTALAIHAFEETLRLDPKDEDAVDALRRLRPQSSSATGS